MSTNRDMVEYFIGQFYRTESVDLGHLVTPTFRFYLSDKLPINFKLYVKMAEAFRNIVNLNISEVRTEDDCVFEMDYQLDVMIARGGFGSEILGKITVVLKDSLVDKIIVTRNRHDEELEKYMPES